MGNCFGYTRILEAILALMLLALPFILIEPVSFHGVESIRGILIDVLVRADAKGDLTRYVYNEEWDEVEKLFLNLLPPNIKFSITIMDEFNNVLYTVNHGLPVNGDIVVASYVLMFRGSARIVILKASR